MPAALTLAVTAVVALVIAHDYGLWSFGSPSAGLMPCLAAAGLLVTSLLALRERRPATDAEATEGAPATEEPTAKARLFGYGVGLLVLPPAIVVLGMLPALGLFVLVLLRAAERARWRTAIMAAAASTALSWLLFVRLLHVPLPSSAFW
jgi:hypothetical protein